MSAVFLMNTADVTGGKPIAVLLQSISGVSAISAFYDIHGGKTSCGVRDTIKAPLLLYPLNGWQVIIP
jgi:hypothetical protein